MTKILNGLADRLVLRLAPGATAHAVNCQLVGSRCVAQPCGPYGRVLQRRWVCDDGGPPSEWQWVRCGC
ncbi:hypothetical protein [Streptomyces clavuligerus]|uniref:Uncharacterized protein n=1 Tax=Streptomyces clavuligerus TaxID=1901 RepID=B5GN72_STRCL|nr:hypothetical protein [Streptomyces clavuligerus]ANW22184.1 hypothetical protein BB341_28005 [Streptomyces clavuligerus]AXU17076.1 hypothetical protein D1794_31060 [Streptomyces clavuligerus]EDY47768.1 hypothetical protein SSCG_00796 [Streptomyces clavuligerus]EFG04243.1 Hypothetical protein SCLAV_p0756 [Streptomyces clavuligerus]MBY6307280.1 hypothetical protein [Streptomyces clavuligerus]